MSKSVSVQNPVLTIIVPTFNRSSALRTTVDDLLHQSFEDFELWIVDQSAPDEAAAIVSYVEGLLDSRVHYLHLTTAGLPNARNEGLRRSKGEIILFVDDDVLLLSRDFLNAHISVYEDPEVGGVTGRHVERVVASNCARTANYVSWSGRIRFNLFGTKRQRINSCKGSNMSFRAAAVAQVGGFDRNLNLLEETDYSERVIRAGWVLIFEPKAEVVHLSIASGGVRQTKPVETEYERFRSTAYFIFKHRGYLGFLPFAMRFTLLAISRTLRYRSLNVFIGCQQAMLTGLKLARSGPDQLIEKRGLPLTMTPERTA